LKVLVTGGAGFVGSNLVDRLVNDGHDVYVWDNLVTGKKENVNSNAKFFYISVDSISPEYVYKTLCFDVIFHLAALARIQPSFKMPVENLNCNVVSTMRALELARLCKARFVYSGSSSFYHDVYANPYTFTKWQGEECCKLYNKVYGVSTAIARFFNVYGPRHICEGDYATVIGIFEKQRAEGLPLTVTGDGQQRRDFTHVNDIVDGLVRMSKDNWNADVFNLGTSKNHSVLEVAKMFKPKEIKFLPKRPGEAKDTLADTSFTQEKLGWKAKESLEEYVKEFVSRL
jgi:UDP-glucose 4-epimerase